jgi:hypothetical protein
MPYMRGFSEAAQVTRQAFDGARISENAFAAAASEVWRRGIPQFIGRKSMLSVTDTASAARFGIQVARLSQAGDNGPDRRFVAPDSAGLTAGLASMKPRSEPTVLEPTVDGLSDDAYPLTVLNYAAITPLALDAAARADYAAFLDYAGRQGQIQGFGVGNLPLGYQPLPASLTEQTRAAADTVRSLQPLAPTAPPPPAAAPAATVPTVGAAPSVGTSSSPAASRPRSQQRTPSSGAGVVSDSVPVVEEEATSAEVEAVSEAVPAPAAPTVPVISTPTTDVPAGRAAVPVLGGFALLSALAALEISKRPRRLTSSHGAATASGRS